MRTQIFSDAEHTVSLEHDHCYPNSGYPLLCIEYSAISKVHAGETHLYRDDDLVDGIITGAEAKQLYESRARAEGQSEREDPEAA